MRFGARVKVVVGDKVSKRISMMGSDGRTRTWRIENNENRVRDDRMSHLT